MRSLVLPRDQAESQNAVLERIRASESDGLVALARVIVVRDGGAWYPACGRMDIMRALDAPRILARPSGNVRLLVESMSVIELAERLGLAFRGEAFVVEDEAVRGHGMDAVWGGTQHTDDWEQFGFQWPVSSFAEFVNARETAVTRIL